MALPANVSFGTVTGRFLTATADAPTDTDRDPEGIAASDLTIRFTPNVTPAVVRDASSTPPTIFALAEIPATVGASGDLIGADGQPGIRLVASTGTTIDPSGWTWKVTLSSPTFPALAFSFALDPGQTIDLATVVQVPASPGATLAAWLQAVADANAAADRAEAAASGGGGGASDAGVAALVADTGTATGNALATRYATVGHARPAGQVLVALGDSITRAGDTPDAFQFNDSFALYAQALSGSGLYYKRNAGIGGNTTAQMLARFDTDVTPHAPTLVTVMSGTNDFTFGVTDSDYRTQTRQLVEKIRAIGAVPVLFTSPPVNTLPGADQQRIYRNNAWKVQYGRQQNIPVVDAFSILIDPASTGNYLPGYDNGDGIHPNAAGHYAIGKEFARQVGPFLTTLKLVSRFNADPLNLLTNGLFLTDSNGDGQADGWDLNWGTDSGSFTFAIGADAKVPGGKVQRVTFTAATGRTQLHQTVTSGFTPGDVMQLVCLASNSEGIEAQLNVGMNGGNPLQRWSKPVTRGLMCLEFPVPAGATSLDVTLTGLASSGAARTGVVEFGAVTLRNLTASTLTSL